MSYVIIFDVAAETDLAKVYDYLMPRSGHAHAKAYVDEIIDYCLAFSTFPQRGSQWHQSPGLRVVGYRKKATIAFRIKDNVVTIMRVFHRGQDIDLSTND